MAFRGVFRPSLFLAALVAGVWFGVRAFADDPPKGEAAFLAENDKAMSKMMAGMAVKPSGDIDRDFAAMMIPHHQGAIDMAQAELRHGKNEQLRRIAQEIIVDQLQEIAAMKLALGDPLPPSVASPTEPDAATGEAGSQDHSAHDHSGMSHGPMQMPSNSKMK
jgi:Domain of unknown function (DUF305)